MTLHCANIAVQRWQEVKVQERPRTSNSDTVLASETTAPWITRLLQQPHSPANLLLRFHTNSSLAFIHPYRRMVAPKVKQETVVPCSTTDVAIIGGGVVGVIAANRMRERCIDYRVIERLHDFGGVWHTHSNNHSTLQVPPTVLYLCSYTANQFNEAGIACGCLLPHLPATASCNIEDKKPLQLNL